MKIQLKLSEDIRIIIAQKNLEELQKMNKNEQKLPKVVRQWAIFTQNRTCSGF